MKIKHYFYKLITFGFSALVIIGTEPQMIIQQIEAFL